MGNIDVSRKATFVDLCVLGNLSGASAGWAPSAESDLDMNGYDVENVGNLTVIGKATFNDLCIMGNVDGLIAGNVNGPVFVGSFYTVQDDDTSILGNVSPIILTLPSASANFAEKLHVRTDGNSNVFSDANNVIIPFDFTPGNIILSIGEEWTILQSDGTDWVATIVD